MFVAHCCDTLKIVSANQFAISKLYSLSFRKKKNIKKNPSLREFWGKLCAVFPVRVRVIMAILVTNLNSVFPIVMIFVVI